MGDFVIVLTTWGCVTRAKYTVSQRGFLFFFSFYAAPTGVQPQPPGSNPLFRDQQRDAIGTEAVQWVLNLILWTQWMRLFLFASIFIARIVHLFWCFMVFYVDGRPE